MTGQSELHRTGRALRARRKALNLSQEALAERAGVHRNYIGLLERGERNPPLTTLLALARALETSLAVLLADVDDRTGEPA